MCYNITFIGKSTQPIPYTLFSQKEKSECRDAACSVMEFTVWCFLGLSKEANLLIQLEYHEVARDSRVFSLIVCSSAIEK